jgi:hypothetical protein
MELKDLRANPDCMDKKVIKKLTDKLEQPTKAWVNAAQEMIQEHQDKNPLELSRAIETNLLMLVMMMGHEKAKELCIILGYRALELNSISVTSREDAVHQMKNMTKKERPDYVG